MNKVIYGSYTFQDADLTLVTGGTANLYWAPLGDELRAAYFSIPIQFYPRTWHVPAIEFKAGLEYGAAVDIYEDSALLMRFYLTDITGGQRQQDGSYIFNLIGTDFVGLYQKVRHLGGIYTNAQAGAVIAGILGAVQTAADADKVTYQTSSGITYTVDADIAAARIDNWLPATEDARENLRNVLQVLNAAVMQNTDGSPRIGVMDHGAEIVVSEYDTYTGDSYIEEAPVTAVQVIEYAYLQISGTAEAVILDASNGVQEDLVLFDKPYYDIHGDANLSVLEQGANYARITGTGILYGKPYTVMSRTLIDSTGLTGASNIRTIDNPLCSSLYSSELLSRLNRYFANVSLIQHAVKMLEQFDPGHLLKYIDPMNEEKRGYPLEQTLTFSGITKADQKITADWTPMEENPFTESQLVTSSGTWSPPAGATRLRFVLIGGGKGGWGGYQGEAGEGSSFNPSTSAGAGGAVGEGGEGGKVFQIDVSYENLLGSYTVSIGAAGTAGGINHGEGTEGGATTLTAGADLYTSANGVVYPYGVMDILTGVRYAATGQDGIYPGNSGVGTNYPLQKSINDSQTSQTGTVTTWNDGNTIVAGVVGGGGAAYGSNGGNASRSNLFANGGVGATAALDGFNGYTAAAPTIPGTGGIGGNGGGGGGCGGTSGDGDGGNGGAPGDGSVGGGAAPGAVLILIAYGIPPTPVDDGLLFDADGEALYDADYERLKEEA